MRDPRHTRGQIGFISFIERRSIIDRHSGIAPELFRPRAGPGLLPADHRVDRHPFMLGRGIRGEEPPFLPASRDEEIVIEDPSPRTLKAPAFPSEGLSFQ